MTTSEVRERFEHQGVTPEGKHEMEAMRQKFSDFAVDVNRAIGDPLSPAQARYAALALTKLEEAKDAAVKALVFANLQ